MAIVEFIRWNPDPVLLTIGNFQPKWYGVLFVTGFALGYLFFKKEAVKQHIPVKNIDSLLYLVLGFAILGARLAHVFFYDWPKYEANPIDILKIWEGGLASHGGGMGMVLGTWIWATYIQKNIDMWKVLDLIAIPTPLAGAFIRFGNLWNSEILGKPTDVPWAFIFEARDQVPRHPVQLYEAICYILGSFLLYVVYKKVGLAKRGLLVALFLLVIFIPRFVLEFFKVPQENYEQFFVLNTGQMLSIPFIITGAVAAMYIARRKTM